MSPEETWVHGVKGLAAQGWRHSMNVRGDRCVYRSPDGCKCGAGLFIPDALYNEDMEYKTIGAVLRMFGEEVVAGANLRILEELQTAHDSTSTACDARYPGASLEQAVRAIGEQRGWAWPL